MTRQAHRFILMASCLAGSTLTGLLTAALTGSSWSWLLGQLVAVVVTQVIVFFVIAPLFYRRLQRVSMRYR